MNYNLSLPLKNKALVVVIFIFLVSLFIYSLSCASFVGFYVIISTLKKHSLTQNITTIPIFLITVEYAL